MTGLDVLNRELNLPEEWVLGAGGAACWAPPSPTRLELPGFRDEGRYHQHVVAPVFAITLLDHLGRPFKLRASERNWTPARLELKYRIPNALITERRTVLSSDVFLCEWTMTHAAQNPQQVWLVQWTRRPDGVENRGISEIEANPQGISFQESLESTDERWGCAFGASFDADCWSVNSVASSDDRVTWESSPFFELMAPGGLPGHSPACDPLPGYVYMAQAFPFEVPPGERLVSSFAMAFSSDVEHARQKLERAVSTIHPIHASEEEWISWFEDVPDFACSDPYIQRMYWYRWAQRRLWPAASGEAFAQESESSQPADLGSVLESAWHHCPHLSQQLLRNAVADEKNLLEGPLGLAVRRVLSLHPDRPLQRAVCAGLRRLIANSWDQAAGAVDATRVDWDEPVDGLNLCRSAYLYDLLRLLENLDADADSWSNKARELSEQFHRTFWDPQKRFFTEQLKEGQSHRSVATGFGFLPLLTRLADGEQRESLREHLYDPERFWTLHPIPSLSRDDVDFSADGRFHNQRLDQPWNGRVWLDLCSHVVEGLGQSIERSSSADRILLAQLVERVLRFGFVDDDVDRPGFYEHYNPLNGRPALFRGRRFQNSGWFIDHILRYVAGVRPSEDGSLLIDPLPFHLEWFSVHHLQLGAHELDIEWDQRSGLTIRIDDEPAGHAPAGQSLAVSLPATWAVA